MKFTDKDKIYHKKSSLKKFLTENSQITKMALRRRSTKYFSGKILKRKIYSNVNFSKRIWKKNVFFIIFYVKRFIEKIKLENVKRKFEKLNSYHYNLIFDLSEIPKHDLGNWQVKKRQENERILKIYKKYIIFKALLSKIKKKMKFKFKKIKFLFQK